jgi:hypothetical protein
MKITLKDLRKHGACEGQVDLFKTTFGKEIILTEALVMEYGTTFALGWVARNLFPAPLYADYQAKIDTLYADYAAKRAPLYADYQAKIDTLDADYAAKRAPLFWSIAKDIPS